ncbi:MAG: YHS domain-containing protein [Thermodesulfobacteriota bacterium]
MSPLKLVILALLFYVGYRLLTAGRGEKKKGEKSKGVENGGDPSVSDVLVEDPVCHTLIPREQAIGLQYQGEMVYFCSEKCCDHFVEQKGEG